jgi:hypothetical protein
MASSSSHSSNTKSGINSALIGAVFLGICILIAGINIGGGVRKLNKTISEKSFSDVNTYNAADSINYSEKKYLTESEAAEYLNLSTAEIVNLITSGEINEYVKTSDGYSIAVTVLDSWFDNESYQNKLAAAEKAADSEEE